jgi:hypothetical protein
MKPFWLAAPSRFADLSRDRARIVLAVLVAALLASLLALVTVGPPPVSGDPAKRASDDQTDVVLYESIVSGIRHGGDYYEVTAHALRSGDYPLRPFVTFRLPALAMAQAHLPRLVTIGMMYLLALVTFLAWAIRLRPALPRIPPFLIALALACGGMMAFVQRDLWAFHEIWAGLLLALSLAVRRKGHWMATVAIALAAMLIRETAALYALVMLGFAWIEGERREAIGWAAALALLAAALGAHAWAVHAVTTSSDPGSPGWAGMHGFGFFLKAWVLATALQLFPLGIGAALATLALFGWASWRDPLAARMLATLCAFGLALALFARPDTFYWALMIAPISLVGLAFVPDGLRDLIVRALDNRRIKVRRVA